MKKRDGEFCPKCGSRLFIEESDRRSSKKTDSTTYHFLCGKCHYKSDDRIYTGDIDQHQAYQSYKKWKSSLKQKDWKDKYS